MSFYIDNIYKIGDKIKCLTQGYDKHGVPNSGLTVGRNYLVVGHNDSGDVVTGDNGRTFSTWWGTWELSDREWDE